MFDDLLSECLSKKIYKDIKREGNPIEILFVVITAIVIIAGILVSIFYRECFDNSTYLAIVLMCFLIVCFALLYFFTRTVYDFGWTEKQLNDLEIAIECIKNKFNEKSNKYTEICGLDKKSIIIKLIEDGEEKIDRKVQFKKLITYSVGIPLLLGFITSIQNPLSFFLYLLAVIIFACFCLIGVISSRANKTDSLREIKQLVYVLKIMKLQ